MVVELFVSFVWSLVGDFGYVFVYLCGFGDVGFDFVGMYVIGGDVGVFYV